MPKQAQITKISAVARYDVVLATLLLLMISLTTISGLRFVFSQIFVFFIEISFLHQTVISFRKTLITLHNGSLIGK